MKGAKANGEIASSRVTGMDTHVLGTLSYIRETHDCTRGGGYRSSESCKRRLRKV